MVRLQFNPSDLVEAKVHAQKDSLQLPISTKNEEKEKPLPKRSSDFSFMILFSVCIAMWMSVDLYFYFTSDLPILSKFWNELFREKHGSEKHRAEVYQKILQIALIGLFLTISSFYLFFLALKHCTKFVIYIIYLTTFMTFIYVAVRSIDDQAYLENKFVKIPALVTFLGIVFTTISLVDDFDDIVLILKETGRAILASKWTLMFPLLKNVLLWSIFIFGINLMPLYHKELSLRPPFEAIIVSLNLMAIIWLMAWIYGLFEMVHSGKFTGWYKAFYANKKFEKSYGHYFWTAITMNSGTAVIGGLMPFGHLICFIFSGIIAILSIPFYFFLPSIYTKIAKFVENRILNHMHYDNVYIVTSNYHTSLIESIVLIANDNLWKFTRKSKVTIISKFILAFGTSSIFNLTTSCVFDFMIDHEFKHSVYVLLMIYIFYSTLAVFYFLISLTALNCMMFSACQDASQNTVSLNDMSARLLNVCLPKRNRTFSDPIMDSNSVANSV